SAQRDTRCRTGRSSRAGIRPCSLTSPTSWPGLSRPSTSCFLQGKNKDVDARDISAFHARLRRAKRGHDELWHYCLLHRRDHELGAFLDAGGPARGDGLGLGVEADRVRAVLVEVA